jgi:hypothetical protein
MLTSTAFYQIVMLVFFVFINWCEKVTSSEERQHSRDINFIEQVGSAFIADTGLDLHTGG